jgi:hypothetical protein
MAAARKATLHASMSSLRRVRALPCGLTLPRLDAIRSVDSLPKKNFTEPSGFWRGSAESNAALIGQTYLSSRE